MNKTTKKMAEMYKNEINDGLLLRGEYAKETGIPVEDLIRSDVYPYNEFPIKGTQSTEFDIGEYVGGSGSGALGRGPIYKALLDEIRRKKLLEQASGK